MAKKEKSSLELFYEYITKIYKNDMSLCENHEKFCIAYKNEQFVIWYGKEPGQIYNEYMILKNPQPETFELRNFIKEAGCVVVDNNEFTAFRRTVKGRLLSAIQFGNEFVIQFNVAVDTGETSVNEKGKTVKVKREELHELKFIKTEIPKIYSIDRKYETEIPAELIENTGKIIRLYIDNEKLSTVIGRKIFNGTNNNLNGIIKIHDDNTKYTAYYGTNSDKNIVEFVSNGSEIEYHQFFRVIF